MENNFSLFLRKTKNRLLEEYQIKDIPTIDYSNKELSTVEENLKIDFNLYIRFYFYYFGKGFKGKNINLNKSLFNLETTIYAGSIAKNKELISRIKKIKKVGGWYDKEISFNNSEILFLKYDETSSSHTFIDNKESNPIIYTYWEGDEITSDNYTITTTLRDAIFWETCIFNNILANENKITSFYRNLFTTKPNIKNYLITLRYKFNTKELEVEIKHNKIKDFFEYEKTFIRFIENQLDKKSLL